MSDIKPLTCANAPPADKLAVTPECYAPSGYARGLPLPWRVKMGAKLVLSRLPVAYRIWSRLGLFRHGEVKENFRRLHEGFAEHVTAYKERFFLPPRYYLELGPGDSVGRALSAAAMGAEKIWLVDVGDYASCEPGHYRAFYEYLRAREGFSQSLPSFDRAAVLDFARADYRTHGLADLRMIPSDSVDLSFSNAVLEHVARDEFAEHMKELYRIHKPGSLSRHWVDLHDHLGGALNNLRFSPAFWESRAVRKSGFYTNRLLMKEMAGMAEKAGFLVEIGEIHRWAVLPTAQGKMDGLFSGHSEEDLNICTFLILLTKPPAA